MNILIVGGNSSTGVALKEALSHEHTIVTADRSGCDINFDLKESVDQVFFPKDIDVLIHTAAHFGGKSNVEMQDAIQVNVVGTLKVCQLANKANIKHIILLSSMSACVQSDNLYYGIYAITKRQAEEVAVHYCGQHGILLTILRPSQIYGNDDNFRKNQPFIYLMMDNAENNEDIFIYGSHDAQRNYIYIDDLISIITKVAEQKVNGTYACLFPEDVRYTQIAQVAINAFRSNSQVLFLTDKSDIPDNVFTRDNTLYEKIGFFPKISIEEGIRKCVAHRKTMK